MKTKWFALLLFLAAVPALAQQGHDAKEKTPALGPRAFVDVPADAVEKTYAALNAAMPAPATTITKMGITDYLCTTSPGNPPLGQIRFYCDSGTNKLVCIDSTGANACPGGGGGGGSPGGISGALQCNVASSFGACNATDLSSVFTVNEPTITLNGNVNIQGPKPYSDLANYGGYFSGSPQSTTASTTNGSTAVTLAAAIDFQDATKFPGTNLGNGIVIYKAGAATALGTPPAPTVSPYGITGGVTTYTYNYVAEDLSGGLTAASANGATTVGASALGVTTLNLTAASWNSTLNGEQVYTCSGNCNISVNSPIRVDGFTNTHFNGNYTIIALPDSTHFTVYSPQTPAVTSESASATVKVLACNQLTLPANSLLNTVEVGADIVQRWWLYRNGAVAAVVQSRDPYYEDCGVTISGANIPSYVPSTPPVSAVNKYLVSTIVSGAGTTNIVLANQAGATVSGATALHDNSKNLLTALNASHFGYPVYVPGNAIFNATTTFSSALTSNTEIILPRGASISQPWIVKTNGIVFTGGQGTGSDSFEFGNHVQLVGSNFAFPTLMIQPSSGNSTGNGVTFKNITFNAVSVGQTAFVVDFDQNSLFGLLMNNVSFLNNGSVSNINTSAAVFRGITESNIGMPGNRNTCATAQNILGPPCMRFTATSLAYSSQAAVAQTTQVNGFAVLGGAPSYQVDSLPYGPGLGAGISWKDGLREIGKGPFLRVAIPDGLGFFTIEGIDDDAPNTAPGNGFIDTAYTVNQTSFITVRNLSSSVPTQVLVAGAANETLGCQSAFAAGTTQSAALNTPLSGIYSACGGSAGTIGNGLGIFASGVSSIGYLMAQPAAPTVAISGGTGPPANTYFYGTVAFDANGNSTGISPASNSIAVNGSQGVLISWTPLAGQVGTAICRGLAANNINCLLDAPHIYTGTSFLDTNNPAFYSNSPPNLSNAKSASLGSFGVSGNFFQLVGNGFTTTFSASGLSAARTVSVPDATGTMGLLNASSTFVNADCLQVLKSGSVVTIVDSGNICGGGGGGGATFQVNGTNTSTQTLINFQSASAFGGLTVAFSNPSAGNVTLGLSGTATKALLPATTVYTDQINTYGAFLQDFTSASLKVPNSSGAAPTTNSLIAYDTTANRYTAGLNAANVIFPWFASGTPINLQCPLWSGTAGLMLSIPCASTANPLSQFASTTSLQLAGVISDETGTGQLVFATNPTIVTPTIASFVNAQHNHANAAGGGQITDAALSSPVGATKGGTGLSSIAADQVAVATAANVFAATSIPDCTTAGNGHLNYAVATHLFACGTSGAISGLTTNVIPKAASSTSIADSLLTDNGTTLSYTGTGGVTATGYAATGAGGLTLTGTEGTAPSGVTGSDIIWADSTAHRWKANSNNGGATTVAMFSDPLSVFAATTSAQLAGVLSDEVGSGALMFSPKRDIMDASAFCADAGASGTTYLCSLTPAITAYVTGTHYRFKANTANTAASTINFNSLGAITIKKASGGITTDLIANDMRAGQWVDLVYDGTNMQMQSTSGNGLAGSGTVTSVALSLPAFITVSGSPVTTNGTLTGTLANENANTIFSGPASGAAAAPTFRAMVPADVVLGVNAQAGAGYTVVAADQGKLVSVTNANPQTISLPSSAQAVGWWIAIENTGTGTWTVSRNGLNIDGAASNVTLTTNQGILVYSDGSNYFTQRGVGGAGGGSVTTTGSPASGNLTKFSGATSITNGDLAGDVTTSGTLTATLANIPTAIPMAGSIVSTEIAAPSSPAAGKDSLYTDSTDLRFHDKNASGVIGTTVVADTGASNNFLTAISAAGAISKAQPTFANLAAGTVAAKAIFPGGDFFNGGIDAQVGTSYTVVAADENKLLTFNNGSATAVTLPQATTAGFTVGAVFSVSNLGAGAVTITPTTSTINGNATVVLNQNQGALIVSDGTNYSAWVSAAPSGSGTVTSVAESFTGGLISVGGSPITTSGTLALTVAGTSGGIVCFTGASTWASSAALTANNVVLGGGAGVCPTVTATDTTTTHALFATAGAPAFRAIVAGDIPNLPLQQIVSPTGSVATFADGDNPIVFNSASTTSARVAFTIGETTASTAASTAKLVLIQTLNTSTAVPLTITQGTGVNATDNVLALSVAGGAGGANAGATSPGKLGGGVTFTTGAGSAAGATSGTGGAGGDINLTGGTGGAAAVGSTTGAGGNVILTPGAAGATGTAGSPGQVKIVAPTVSAALTTPFLNITGTWNTTGVVDAAIFVNVTNTASGTGSLLEDLQIGGISEFKVDKTGAGIFNSSVTTTGATAGAYLCTQGSEIGAQAVNTFAWECPAAVTAYRMLIPPASAQGVMTGTVSGVLMTESFSGDANHAATVTIGSGTSIGSTQLCSTANCPAGTYRVNVYEDITTACGTSGTYVVNLIYTDDQGSKTIPVNINGTGAVPSTGVLTTTSTANFGENAQIIRSTGAASINYSTTAVACGTAGPMVGKLYLSVENVQ